MSNSISIEAFAESLLKNKDKTLINKEDLILIDISSITDNDVTENYNLTYEDSFMPFENILMKILNDDGFSLFANIMNRVHENTSLIVCVFYAATKDNVFTVIHNGGRKSINLQYTTDDFCSIFREDGKPPDDIDIEKIDILNNAFLRLKIGIEQSKVKALKPFVKNTITNKRKLKKEKDVKYEFKTIEIKRKQHFVENKDIAITGRNRSSPALHDRRGHWRRLSEDRKVWVKSSKVGNKDKGLLKKTYVITTA